MDLRKIRQFVAVAEELHFGRAAERLKMAQPPLSQAIRRLEVELGVALFDRTNRSVALTEAGRIYLAESRRTIAQADLACTLAQRAGVPMPEVRIGFINSALNRILPELIVKFRGAQPDVKLDLSESSSVGQLEQVRAGQLDVAFVSTPIANDAGVEWTTVERSFPMAVVPADSPLAEMDVIDFAELAKQPLILPPDRYVSYFADALAMFSAIGALPHVTQEVGRLGTALRLVGAGLGCTIMLQSARASAPRNVKFLKIENAPVRQRWELSMAWEPRHLAGAASRFVEMAKAHVAETPELLDPDHDDSTG
ncbi:MAG TPA: LysR substrate-binding domain-containing protein [Novosphingobium sp.]|nr:LysR substrate-binding domain-containing protein [Novosphingobium sp.]